MKKLFSKILVANRGEIALRIMKTCREMGIKTVAVYSDADQQAVHVMYADEAYHIGESPSPKSYLNKEKILSIAKESGAQAIHPGYGFLAENAQFAKECEKKGITFIGPNSWSLAQAGDKIASRKLAQEAGIQVTPGSEGAVTDKNAKAIANGIGYPVILKSSAGGGGMGMGVVEHEDELLQKLEIAQSTALSAFGNADILMEKYLKNPRHIEFQILADQYGSIIHLGERECSVQRRFQKLIEEAPSVVVTESMREKIGAWSVAIARTARYVNAGTIEYLYNEGEFYFNEINARLQVEHPVTELVMGIDLIEWQIRIACGETIPFSQKDIKPRGWAIECRINAEDPYNNFLPSPGTVTCYEPPTCIGVRVDSGIHSGSTVSSFYDSLLAKVIVWGETREKALLRMRRVLNECTIDGIETNIPFHKKVFENEVFLSGDMDTNFIPKSGIITTIMQEGQDHKKEMARNAAVASAVIAMSKRGIKNYLKIQKKNDTAKTMNPWKMAGRSEQLRRGVR